MGKSELRVIVVSRRATVLLLVLTSLAIIALIWLLSGKAYASGEHPFRDVVLALLAEGRSLSSERVLVGLMPALANVLLFVPWGFFMFLAADRPTWRRSRTYALTFVGAILFAACIHLWQTLLPTRVTMPTDALANGVGALAGAVLGHMRREVRVQFDH